jgi:hypothetical protein
MVEIIYIPDATVDYSITGEYETIAEFIMSNFTDESEVKDLIFYKGDTLGTRLKTSDTSFLYITDGTYTVMSSKNIPGDPVTIIVGVVAGLLVGAVVGSMMMKSLPEVSGRDQQSSTNAMTRATNKDRINERTDDIFGTVNKHTPCITQLPYTIGIKDIECEMMFGFVGRGKYLIHKKEIYDNFTPYVNNPKASIAIYPPGTHPGNGSPQLQIGAEITQPLGLYRSMSDIQQDVLTPPNNADRSDIIWSMIYNGDGTATMTIINTGDVDVDLSETITVGNDVSVVNAFYYSGGVTVSLRYGDMSQGGSVKDFTDYTGNELNGNYVVTNVTTTTVTFTVLETLNYNNWKLVLSPYQQPTPINMFYDNVGIKVLTTFNITDVDLRTEWWIEKTGDQGVYFAAVKIESSSFSTASVNYINSIYVGPYVIDDGATLLITNLNSANGYYRIDGNNDLVTNAKVEILIEEIDNEGNPTGQSTPYVVDYGSNPDKTTKSVFRTFESDVTMYTRKRVVYRRITDTDLKESVSNVDDITLNSVYTFEPCDLDNMGDATKWYSLVPNNGQKERKTNMNVTRMVTEYLGDGQFGPTESHATDSFDQIIIHQSLDPKIGRLTLPEINADGFMLTRDAIIDYFGEAVMTQFGYNFDTTDVTYQQMFTTVCDAVNCIPYTRGAIYDMFFERRQDVSSMQITCRNKDVASEIVTETSERKYDGVALTYRNNKTATHEVIMIPNDNIINPDRTERNGITTEIQALRKAWRIYNKQKYTLREVSFDVDEFGRNVVPGKRLDSPDGTRFTSRDLAEDGYKIYDGQVVEVTGMVVELDNTPVFTQNEDHYITFTNEDGSSSQSIMCTPGDDDYKVVLQSLPSEGMYDGYNRDQTKFVFMSEQLNDSIALLPQNIESSIDDGNEVNTITSINYDHRYYNGDTVEP